MLTREEFNKTYGDDPEACGAKVPTFTEYLAYKMGFLEGMLDDRKRLKVKK